MLHSFKPSRLCAAPESSRLLAVRNGSPVSSCRRHAALTVRASAKPQEPIVGYEATTSPYLKCKNAFTDDWVVMKGEETLELSFRDTNNYLLDNGVGPADAVRPKDAQRMLREEGYTMVDLRIQWSRDEWHLQDSVHMPMMRVIEGNGPSKIWRKFGHALFVEFPPIEHNYPNWLEGMLDKFDKDDKILLACDLGGLLDENLVKAVCSNSFEAMFMLKQAGFTNVKYLQGGFCAWRAQPELVARTEGVVDNVPWFKTMPGISGFFPAPCNWTHVRRCACSEDDDVLGASAPCKGDCRE